MKTTRDTQISVHGATAITTRASCINGTWSHEILVRIGDDGDQELKLVVYSDEGNRLALHERPDEWVHVETTDPEVVRSDKPLNGKSPSRRLRENSP